MTVPNLVVALALICLVGIGWRRHQRGKDVQKLRQGHGLPAQRPFSRNAIPRWNLIVRVFRISAIATAVCVPAFLATAGPTPPFDVGSFLKAFITIATFPVFVVFVSSGGFLLQCRLIDRYGDRPN
ncbi:MAG TPA: hypothetical protein VN428_17125 [Bryobacteraceae bacterium]|nr:hypothetical protein [Bryobacteraceae bacterium]